MVDKLLELGKYKVVDLHGFTKEEARAEVFYHLNITDNYNSIIFVHGYHGGQVLRCNNLRQLCVDRITTIAIALLYVESDTGYTLQLLKGYIGI